MVDGEQLCRQSWILFCNWVKNAGYALEASSGKKYSWSFPSVIELSCRDWRRIDTCSAPNDAKLGVWCRDANGNVILLDFNCVFDQPKITNKVHKTVSTFSTGSTSRYYCLLLAFVFPIFVRFLLPSEFPVGGPRLPVTFLGEALKP